ncbi:DUF835 domain-containing protein [Pyrococcus horikoshii]|nr:DUF835 domain-containing protein [Pyrococcus horikoshii]
MIFEVINLGMRGIIWGFSFYKWLRRKEDFMLLLSITFWFDLLGGLSQKQLLIHFGVEPNPTALTPLMSTFALTEGILLLVASMDVTGRARDLKIIILFIIASHFGLTYILICTLINAPTRILITYPVLFLGFSLILAGYVLLRHEISIKNVSALFPLGMILLGLIDITYPVTVNMSIAPYLYFAGGVFRGMILVGIFKYALFEVSSPRVIGEGINILPGGYYLEDREVFHDILKRMESLGNGVLITRHLPKDSFSFPIFWLTKVVSGPIKDNIIAISPTDLGILLDLVRRHLERGHTVVVIDGFEYIVIENGFETAMKFLLSLKDTAIKYRARLILVTSSQAYSQNQWKIIAREFENLKNILAQ